MPAVLSKIDNKYQIGQTSLKNISNYFDDFHRELGGILLGKDHYISTFIPLKNINNNHNNFEIDFSELNALLDKYVDENNQLIGIIHSHVVSKFNSGSLVLSKSDKEYFNDFLKNNPDIIFLLTPIITLINNKKIIKWYRFSNIFI